MGWTRIAIIAFAFVLVDLLRGPLRGVSSKKSTLKISPSNNKLIHIFYNLFVNDSDDSGRVLRIFDEQARTLNPQLHDMNISINSIGFQLPYFPKHLSREHHHEGGEDVTLRSLWEYCRSSDDHNAKVVYLHSKGSFHPNERNNRLRRFLTEGALSEECANLPDDCDVCSSRMSTHPHPHTSGNMWLARCSYVVKLLDPYSLRSRKLSPIFSKDDGCKGFGRYFFEHWIYSHPSVKPCDLYPGREYTWAYENIPDEGFKKNLRKAPRFDFAVYVGLLREKYWYCREDRSSQTRQGFFFNRVFNYYHLYKIPFPDKSWYLWTYLNVSQLSLRTLQLSSIN